MSSPLYLFLIFAVFLSNSGATTTTTKAAVKVKPVREIFGHPLQSGYKYFVTPYTAGSGLIRSKSHSKTCPKTVTVQDGSIVTLGLAVKISPYDKSRTVHVSTDVNIQFSNASIWKLDNFDKTTKQWFISTCGVAGNPGQKTVDNWFKIEEYEEAYKIRFCPSVCKFCKVMCRDVGLFVQGGESRLVLSDVPLKVTFSRKHY